MTDKTDSKEREAFERALMDLAEKYGSDLDTNDFSRDASGAYANGMTEVAWMLWQARASLASPGFDAADMATASARGFRDGVTSIAASAGNEPVAEVVRNTAEDAQFSPRSAWPLNNFHDLPLGTKLYTHPSPPEGMVMVPLKATNDVACAIENEVDSQIIASAMDPRLMHRQDGSDIWNAAIAAVIAQPTTSAGSGKGE